MVAPYQCTRGHALCFSCEHRVSQCPFCRETFPSAGERIMRCFSDERLDAFMKQCRLDEKIRFRFQELVDAFLLTLDKSNFHPLVGSLVVTAATEGWGFPEMFKHRLTEDDRRSIFLHSLERWISEEIEDERIVNNALGLVMFLEGDSDALLEYRMQKRQPPPVSIRYPRNWQQRRGFK